MAKLSLSEARDIVGKNLAEGFEYDVALQFYDDNDNICELSEEADKAVKDFFDLCEQGSIPEVAFVKTFFAE